jgi:hypothetical protein
MNAGQACRQAARCSGGLLTVILLSGCAEFLAAREQRARGWREARVVQIAAGASIARASPRDCRKEAAPDTAANGRYAVYQYKGVSNSRHYRVAPLPDNVPLKVGDLVRVNIENCSVAPTLR